MKWAACQSFHKNGYQCELFRWHFGPHRARPSSNWYEPLTWDKK